MSDMPLSGREKVFALVFALVSTALLVEIGFRLAGPDYQTFNNRVAEYPSNPRGYFETIGEADGKPIFGVPMNKSVGLGGRQASQGPRKIAKILGLGDSQAQGQGVYFQDTMYEKLSRKLSTKGVQTNIRNAAVSGYDLDEVAARYAYEGRNPEAYDLVLYAMVLDDFGLDRSEISGLDFIQFQNNPGFDSWRARSATWNFVAHIAEQWKLSEKTTSAYLQSFQGENLIARSSQLRRLSEQVESDGGTLIVIVLPLLYDFKQYPFTEIHQKLKRLGQEQGIHVLDLLPTFKAHTASTLWVHSVDHHPNERAHEMIADALFTYLTDNDLIKPLQP